MGTELYQKKEAIKFYENRYKEGYMDEWPDEKKQRVYEVIKMLDLPQTGLALDFGCGNGVFTDVLRQALPKWTIYGSDISKNAVDNAQKRFPECNFFVSDNEKVSNIKFDFLFSHHVLEHVFDIRMTMREINSLLKPKSYVLHIFPCGNENSLEYNVSYSRKNGINKDMENRFFYEYEGHIRRLTTEQINGYMAEHGFTLKKDLYSNQYFGAVKWISQSSPAFIKDFANPGMAKDKLAHKFLKLLRTKFLILSYLQRPAKFFLRVKSIKNKNTKHLFKIIVSFIPFLISYPFYSRVNYKAKKEWEKEKHMINGSEMYVFYGRN